MKKKILVFVMLIFATFTLTGCFGGNPYAGLDDLLNGTGSSPSGVVEYPTSSESIYQTPVEVANNATESQIAEAYMNSTVTIYVTTQTGVDVCFGSGVCVYSGGYIATNYHVVADAITYPSYQIRVYLNEKTSAYEATVLWSDSTLDIAIIQCSYGDIPYVKMADRVVSKANQIKILEKVIAIGTPIDFSLQNTCTVGYVSGLNRYTYSDTNIYETLIQHTAPISQGNSGGPLFDMSGNLVALNTLGSNEGNDLYFAVPIYPVMAVLNRVVALNEQEQKATYQTPKMGITLTDKYIWQITDTTEVTKDGVLVTAVKSGGSFGVLETNDLITKATFNSVDYDIDCRNHLIFAILNCNAGNTIVLEIERDDETKTVSLQLT